MNLPDKAWIQDNFKSKSAAIRYLALELDTPVKIIAAHLGLPYRHVFNIVTKAKKEPTSDKVCPVCKNRKH